MTKVIRVKKECETCGHKRQFLKIKNNIKRFRCGYCKVITIKEIKKKNGTKIIIAESKKKL